MATDVGHLLAARPKLRHDVVLLQSPDGVFPRSVQSSAHIKGALAYRWLSLLSPTLNGEKTLAEIRARLDGPRRQTVAELVGCLIDQGFVTEASRLDEAVGVESASSVAPAVRTRFRAQIEAPTSDPDVVLPTLLAS